LAGELEQKRTGDWDNHYLGRRLPSVVGMTGTLSASSFLLFFFSSFLLFFFSSFLLFFFSSFLLFLFSSFLLFFFSSFLLFFFSSFLLFFFSSFLLFFFSSFLLLFFSSSFVGLVLYSCHQNYRGGKAFKWSRYLFHTFTTGFGVT
jgi:hypothetical protein